MREWGPLLFVCGLAACALSYAGLNATITAKENARWDAFDRRMVETGCVPVYIIMQKQERRQVWQCPNQLPKVIGRWL